MISVIVFHYFVGEKIFAILKSVNPEHKFTTEKKKSFLGQGIFFKVPQILNSLEKKDSIN